MLYKSFFIFFIGASLSLVFTAVHAKQIVHHKQKADVKTCPKDVKEIAKEFLLLELLGRRYLKAKDSCYSNAETKYISQLKDPDEFVEKAIEVASATIKEVTFNEEYKQHDVKIEVETSTGKIIKDTFRFMRFGKAGGPKPEVGCGLMSSRTENALVLSRCMP